MKNFNFFERLWEHSRTLRRVGLVLVMCLITIPQAYASDPHFHLTGETPTGGWSNSGTEWKLSSPASSALNNGATFNEYCTYMWLSEGDYFGLNNGSKRYSRNDFYDIEIKEGSGSGVYGYPADASHTDKSFHYVGATGLVRINAAQTGSGNSYGSQGEWYPYIWVEESLETNILNGSKIMFYFGIADSWNTNWFYLSKEGDQNNNKSYKAYYSTATKLNTRIAVAYVDANTTYYIASAQSGGTCIKMSSNAAAGNLYSLNSSGGNNIYVNTGNVPHFATTSVTKAKGTEASTIAATAANSIFGNAFTYHYYYTTDGGSTFTKFNPADISGLASGTYTVYALGWDGHILVKSDNSVTLKITVPITLNANGGVDGAVTSVNAVNGDAASGGNIAGGSLPTKTNYVFTGFYTSGGTKVINADGEWISNVSGYTDASGNWTCTAGSTLYAHWEDQWNLKGSWDEWGTYKGMPYVSSNTYRVTLELSAGTYDFKVVKRTRGSSDVYYGKESTTFTRPTITSAKGLVTTGGATYNLHVTADIAGDYVFTYVYDADNDNMKVYVKYPCFTDPAGGTIFYLNMESSLKPGSQVRPPRQGTVELLPYASISGGVAYAGNKASGGDHGGVTTSGEVYLDDNDAYIKIQLDCALETGDKITVSTNNDVYVTTSSTRATTCNISKSATYVCPAAFNDATEIYLWRNSSNAKVTAINIERCSNPTTPTAFSTSNVMATTATFSITDAADAESYDLYYASGSPSAPTSGTTATENVTTKTPTITGLSASTTYNIWVRSVCDANHKSSWYALSGNTFKTADFEITDGGKNTSGTPKWSDKSNGNAIVNTDIDGIITGGTVVYSGSGTLTGNDTHGIIFDNDNDELTITVTGMVLPAGAVITIVQHGNSSTSKATGFKISGNSMSPETCNNGSTNYKEMTQTYTVIADDGVAGKNNFKIKWTGTNQLYLKSMKVTGCEEASCTTPTSLSISGDTEYNALEDISLTASATGTDESTTYTWYKGADWATASAASPVQAESTSGATIAIDDCTTSDAGTYWCLISNGDDCEDKVSATVTVSCLTAPSAVSSLSCSTHTTNSLTYTWTKASNASGYVAKLWDNSTCTGDAVASETLGDVATVEFSSLTPGTTYYCKVQSKGNGTVYCEDGGTTDAASGSTDSPSISTFSPADGTTVMSGTTVTINGSTSSTIYYLWGTSSAPANAAAVVSGGTAGTSGAATVTTTGISSSNTYLYAVASEGGVNSTISSASYTIDDTKPTLSSSDPANSATGVNTSGTIVLTFSEALSAVDGTMFTLTNATKGAVAIDGSDNTKVNIAYSGASYSTTVTLATAAGAVADAAGNTSAALSSISFTTKAAPSCSGDPSALTSNELYTIDEMVSNCSETAISSTTSDGTGIYQYGLSNNGKFYVVGTTNGDNSSTGTVEMKKQGTGTITVRGETFTYISWFKGAGSTSCRSIKFVTPSAGKLIIYGKVSSGKGNIELKQGSSSAVDVMANSKNGSDSVHVNITAGATCYLWADGASAALYGIYFDKAPELSSSDPADGDPDVPVSGTIVLTFDESISSVTAAKFSLSTGLISAVAVDGTDDTKVNITYSGLPGSTEVTLSVAAGAVTDAAGNTSAALSDITFTTESTGYAVTAVTSTGTDTYGTVSAAASTVAEGGTTVITAVPATGYKVTNWAVEGTGASIDPSGASNSNTTTLTMGSADATVTVTFGPKTYTLTLDKNGGSANGTATATWNSHTLTGGTDATASNLNNYYLDGYYTEADGGTEIIAALPNLVPTEVTGWISPSYDNYWIHDANETLYAHWWTMIILDPNKDHHGTGTASYDARGIYNGSMIEGFATAMSDISGESGYSLQGFYTSAVGGTKVLNADGSFAADDIADYVDDGKWIYNSSSYARLYAHWAKECTVTYDGNSEDDGDAPDAVHALYGTTITVADNTGSLVKTSSSFVGWNTATNGSGSFYAVGSSFTLTESITLYAQWESCSGGGSGTWYYWFTKEDDATANKVSNDNTIFSSCATYSNTESSNITATIGGNEMTVHGYKNISSGNALGNLVIPSGYKAIEFATICNPGGSSKAMTLRQDAEDKYTTGNIPNNANGVGTITADIPAGTYAITAPSGLSRIYMVAVKIASTGGGCTTHTVSFADGSVDPTSHTVWPSNITGILDGAKIAEPVNPTADGYAFAGWYKEGACSNKWDFSTDVVDDDITLYAKWVDVSGKYTFHYGDGQPTDNTWVIKTFTEAGSGYHKIEDFEIPDADKYPSFFVGYEGAYDTETAHSQIYTWDAATGLGNGHMPIRHWGTRYGSQSELPIAGNGNTAEGAKGTLRISTTGSTNCYVGFYPNGYGLTWNRETTALHATPSPEVFETDVVTLTAAEAAGNFEVKLATEDSYVAYSRTATETAEDQLNDRKVEGESYDIAAGTVGRFQINLSKKEDNYGLRFVPLINRTMTSGNWETDNNWTLWRRPNIKETAYVKHATTIKTPTAQAKKVIVDKTAGAGYPRVSIASGYDGVGGLLVEDHIQVLKMVDDEPTLSDETTYSELEINSSSYGSAALIMGDASTTTAAYTTLYTKAMYDYGYGWVNQYIGTPSANGSIYDFYGSYLYVYSPVSSNWVQANRQPSYAMPTFKAYNLMREESAPGSYSFYDPLVFPGITDGKLKELICDDENDETDPEDNRIGAYMFANSWTAPIDVKAMEESDFDGSEATIYIFNAGSPAQAASAGDPSQTAEDPGQWVSIPVNAAPYLPENLTVIPSMQAFRIVTTEATASLTLDYKKHVYDPAKNRAAGIEIKPLRAPKHNDAKPNILKLYVEAASGYRDNLYLFERQDFSETFDNGWDGSKMFGISNAPQIYGVNGELKTAINAIPDLEGQQVGFKTGKADSEYTITFNYEGDDTWYFNDTKEHESTLISNDAEYTFTTEPGEDSNRFYISATPIMKVTTGVENVQSDDVQSTKVHKVLINDHIYIIRGGRMYDATGKMLK